MNEDSGSQVQPWFAEGLRFRCTGCGKCCTGPSRSVYLSQADIVRLAEFFGMPAGRFVRRYTGIVKGCRVLGDTPGGGECIFLKDKACSAYEARPTQCRTYPWWAQNLQDEETWQEAAAFCEGIDHPTAPLIPAEDIAEQYRLDEANEARQMRRYPSPRSR